MAHAAAGRERTSAKRAATPRRAARGETLTERAYRQLEEQIVTLRLKPGEFLSEYALAESLRIGRTPIREALQRLAREGLVVILPRKGILVSETDPRKQLLVLETRRELERLMSRVGAQRATDEQRRRFRAIAEGMDRAAKANDDITFMRLDRELNLLIAEAAQNEYAARAMRFLQGHSRRFWYLHYKQAADLPLCARLHARQARAIADGDPKAAAAASDRLIDYVETFTRATVMGAAFPAKRGEARGGRDNNTLAGLSSSDRSLARPCGTRPVPPRARTEVTARAPHGPQAAAARPSFTDLGCTANIPLIYQRSGSGRERQ
jgi:DNA-binding GntR family transcriptional regulator